MKTNPGNGEDGRESPKESESRGKSAVKSNFVVYGIGTFPINLHIPGLSKLTTFPLLPPIFPPFGGLEATSTRSHH